jgi:dTMP kinase
MKRGRFITFEGIEGSGKSTQVQLASGWLTSRNLPHLVTREPGDHSIGNDIRRILLSETTASLHPFAEALLYLADRFQHINEVIRPQVEAGRIVLCDRYHDSTIAYQGYGRGLSLKWIENIWAGSTQALVPDVTILLDLDPEAGLKRSLEKLRARGLDESRFEQESLEFHTRVREGFLEIAKQDPKRFRIVDASLQPEKINLIIIEHLSKVIL